jgi:hypothetical protein
MGSKLTTIVMSVVDTVWAIGVALVVGNLG